MHTCPTHDEPTRLHVDLSMGDGWNSAALSELIRSKSAPGEIPAFLFLGRHEARLLRGHLGAAFGEEAVASLKDLYYMGLEVVEVDIEQFLRVAGRKVTRASGKSITRRPAWRDRKTDSLWSLRLG